MVLTRKRAAAPSSSNTDVSAAESTPQSNLSLLASSASCEGVHSSDESPAPTMVAPATATSSRSGLQGSSGHQQADASKQTIKPGSVPNLGSSSTVTVSREMQSSLSDQKTIVQPQVPVLPPSAVVSPSTGTTEGVVPFSGSFTASQIQVLQAAASAPGSSSGGEQPAVVRYKIIYQSPQSGPGTVASGKQPGVSSTVNVGLTSLFPSKPSSSTIRPPIPAAYTLLAAPNKGSSTPRHILVPVSRVLSAPATSGASLLTSCSLVRPPPKPATVYSTSASLLTSPAPALSIASPPISTSIANSAATLKISPASTSTPILLSTSSTTSNPILLPAAPMLLHTTSPQSVMPNSVSHALFKLANSAKAAMTTNPNVVSSTFSAPSAVASSASPVDVSSSITTSAQDHAPSLYTAEEGETTMSWDKESTLELIRLYKEHQAYLNDHHYKKKSVWELIAAKMRQSRKDSPQFRWNHVENKWKNMTKKYRDFVDMNRRNGTNFKCRFHDEIAAIYNYNPDEDQKTAAEGLRALKSGPQVGNSGIVLNGKCDPGTLTAGNMTVSTDSGVVVTKVEKLSPEDSVLGNGSGDTPSSEPLLVKKKKYARLDPPHGSASQVMPKTVLPLPQQSQANSSVNGATNENPTDVASLLKQLREDRARLDKARMDRLEAMHREKMNMFGKFLDILKQSKQS